MPKIEYTVSLSFSEQELQVLKVILDRIESLDNHIRFSTSSLREVKEQIDQAYNKVQVLNDNKQVTEEQGHRKELQLQ